MPTSAGVRRPLPTNPCCLPLAQEHDGEFHDESSAAISIDFEKCIKCGRCVSACGLIQVGKVVQGGHQGHDWHGRFCAGWKACMAAAVCVRCQGRRAAPAATAALATSRLSLVLLLHMPCHQSMYTHCQPVPPAWRRR